MRLFRYGRIVAIIVLLVLFGVSCVSISEKYVSPELEPRFLFTIKQQNGNLRGELESPLIPSATIIGDIEERREETVFYVTKVRFFTNWPGGWTDGVYEASGIYLLKHNDGKSSLIVQDPCSLWDIVEGSIRYFDTYYRDDQGLRKVKHRIDRMTEMSRLLKEERGFPVYYERFEGAHSLGLYGGEADADALGSAIDNGGEDGRSASTQTAGDMETDTPDSAFDTGVETDTPDSAFDNGGSGAAGDTDSLVRTPGKAAGDTNSLARNLENAPPGGGSFVGDIVPYLFPETRRMFSHREQQIYFSEENPLYETSTGETIESAGIYWDNGYSENVLPEQHVQLRNSGTLWRDYEEASRLFYTVYNFNYILSRRIENTTVIRLQKGGLPWP